MSHQQTAEQNKNINMINKPLESMVKIKYMVTTARNQSCSNKEVIRLNMLMCDSDFFKRILEK
jgi:hypothetical protein